MALTQASLSNKLKTNLEGVFDIVDETRLQKFCDAAAKAIVDEIQANAVVLPTALIVTDPDDGPLPVTGTGKVS